MNLLMVKTISTVLRISGDMLNIDWLNLKGLRKRIFCFILRNVNLDIILKLYRKTYIRNC